MPITKKQAPESDSPKNQDEQKEKQEQQKKS